MNNVIFTVDVNDNGTVYYSKDGYQFSSTISDLIDDIVWDIVAVNDTTWELKTLEDINN